MRTRYFLWILVVLTLAVTMAAAAQETPVDEKLASRFPKTESSCKTTQQQWQVRTKIIKRLAADGKTVIHDVTAIYANDWRPHCKLRVYHETPEGVQEGRILFDLDLALAHPATLKEANAAVERWVSKRSIEILKRNGYKVTEER